MLEFVMSCVEAINNCNNKTCFWLKLKANLEQVWSSISREKEYKNV